MSENKSEQENSSKPDGVLKQTIDSATALANAVPIYQDVAQPIAREVGKALGTIGKSVNMALFPLSATVWGYEKIGSFIEKKVSEKLEGVPQERIVTPPLNIAGPAIEALKFSGDEETLQEMFANLIATSLDKKFVKDAHPSFVDIIKNLSPDEGLILRLFVTIPHYPSINVKLNQKNQKGFSIIQKNVCDLGNLANYKHQELVSNYIDNLCRLGILNIPSTRKLNNEDKYKQLINSAELDKLKSSYADNKDLSISFSHHMIETTGFGRQFINARVVDKTLRT